MGSTSRPDPISELYGRIKLAGSHIVNWLGAVMRVRRFNSLASVTATSDGTEGVDMIKMKLFELPWTFGHTQSAIVPGKKRPTNGKLRSLQ